MDLMIRGEAINDAHRHARKFAESAIDYAIRCGQLLLEAKDKVKHGEWQQWVSGSCDFNGRQARRYMQAAKRSSTSELTGDEKLRLGREIWGNKKQVDSEEFDPWECLKVQISGPLNAWDAGHCEHGYIVSRVGRLIDLPLAASFWLSLSARHGDDMMRMCPTDELKAALQTIAPHAEDESEIPIDISRLNRASAKSFLDYIDSTIKQMAETLLNELEFRDENPSFVDTFDTAFDKFETALEKESSELGQISNSANADADLTAALADVAISIAMSTSRYGVADQVLT